MKSSPALSCSGQKYVVDPHMLMKCDLTSQPMQAFPSLYTWTTYPLVTLLEKVWDSGHAALESGKHPDPTIVELCSCLERALNFMHTGNVSVIATSAMNPLWIGLSLIHDGHPCLNPSIASSIGAVCVHANQWPRNNKGQPTSASKGSQLRTYGQGHFNVSVYIYVSKSHLG